MITVEDLSVSYGDIQVLWDVSLEVRESDQVVALVGLNGAGKTTLLRAMSNQLEYSGRIEMFGSDIRPMSPAEVVEHGFVHVPQDRHLFGDLSVEGNLEMGGYTQRDRIQETKAEVFDLFPVLEEKRNQVARTLSGGQQQMLAVGRGLMAGPRVLALDEPSTGLAPQLTERLFERIDEISDRITVLLVEQHVSEALDLSERAYLLENGRVIAHGSSDELRDSQRLRKAYLRE